jgi:hypothetical protein
LNKLYDFNEILASFSFNIPKIYKNSYLDYAIKGGLETFEMFYVANGILINNYTSDSDFKERKQLLRKGIAKLNGVMSNMSIFIDHLEKSPDLNKEKFSKYKENLSLKVADIENMVRKVIQYGDDQQKKVKQERNARKKLSLENISE